MVFFFNPFFFCGTLGFELVRFFPCSFRCPVLMFLWWESGRRSPILVPAFDVLVVGTASQIANSSWRKPLFSIWPPLSGYKSCFTGISRRPRPRSSKSTGSTPLSNCICLSTWWVSLPSFIWRLLGFGIPFLLPRLWYCRRSRASLFLPIVFPLLLCYGLGMDLLYTTCRSRKPTQHKFPKFCCYPS